MTEDEVARLRAELARCESGMRQLLRQRDAAEALLEDVRGKVLVGDWPSVTALLVGEVDR